MLQDQHRYSVSLILSLSLSMCVVPRQSSTLLPALSLSEKATVYLELANMHTLLGQQVHVPAV